MKMAASKAMDRIHHGTPGPLAACPATMTEEEQE